MTGLRHVSVPTDCEPWADPFVYAKENSGGLLQPPQVKLNNSDDLLPKMEDHLRVWRSLGLGEDDLSFRVRWDIASGLHPRIDDSMIAWGPRSELDKKVLRSAYDFQALYPLPGMNADSRGGKVPVKPADRDRFFAYKALRERGFEKDLAPVYFRRHEVLLDPRTTWWPAAKWTASLASKLGLRWVIFAGNKQPASFDTPVPWTLEQQRHAAALYLSFTSYIDPRLRFVMVEEDTGDGEWLLEYNAALAERVYVHKQGGPQRPVA